MFGSSQFKLFFLPRLWTVQHHPCGLATWALWRNAGSKHRSLMTAILLLLHLKGNPASAVDPQSSPDFPPSVRARLRWRTRVWRQLREAQLLWSVPRRSQLLLKNPPLTKRERWTGLRRHTDKNPKCWKTKFQPAPVPFMKNLECHWPTWRWGLKRERTPRAR